MEQRRADGASHPPAKSAQGPARGAYLTMNPRPVNSASGNRAGGVFLGGGGRRPDAGCQIPDAGCRMPDRSDRAGIGGRRGGKSGSKLPHSKRGCVVGAPSAARSVWSAPACRRCGGGDECREYWRSADFQSAVPRVSNPPGAGEPGGGADWKWAIQQVGNLRYGVGGRLPPGTARLAVPAAAEKRPQAAALQTLARESSARSVAERVECAGLPALLADGGAPSAARGGACAPRIGSAAVRFLRR